MKLSQFQTFQSNEITPCTQIWCQTYRHINDTLWNKIRTPIWDNHLKIFFDYDGSDYKGFNHESILSMNKMYQRTRIFPNHPEQDIRNAIS